MGKFNLLLITLFSLNINSCTIKEAAAYDENGAKIAIESFVQTVKKNDNYLSTEVSFYDDDYSYYVYHIGDIKNIPLDSQSMVFSYFGGDTEYTFSMSEMTSHSLQTTTSRMITSTFTFSKAESMNIKTNITGGEKDVIQTGVETGYSMVVTNGQSQTTSWTNSYTECETYSKTLEKSFKIKLNSSCEHGYYRYMLFGDVHVYAAIIKSLHDNQTVYLQTYSEIFSYKYGLDYKETDDFDMVNPEKIEFDLSYVSDLNKPSFYYDRYPPYNHIGKTTSFEVSTMESHAMSLDLSPFYMELFNKGYNKIDISFSFYVTDSLADVHGYLGYSKNENDSLYSYDIDANGSTFSKSIENCDYNLFSTHMRVYLIIENRNLLFKFSIKDLKISVTIRKEK